ncbi:MAG: HAD family hydrolase [Euzebya sp.]
MTSLHPGGRRAGWVPAERPGLVLLDLDGTLMGPGGVVTAPVVEAVHLVVDAGVAVGFATGRNVAGVASVQDQLGIAGPHIVLNGAQVRVDGRALRTWPLTAGQREAVLALCTQQDMYAEFYADEGFLVTSLDQRYRPHWDEVIGQPLGALADHPDVLERTIKATIVTSGTAQRDAVISAVRGLGLNAGAATSPVTPQFTYINITHPDVDKGTALVVAGASLGLDPAAVVAVGDGANDLPMLLVAGTAIAMGDAAAEVIEVAHHVVPGVLEDGAAVALRAVHEWSVS